MSEVQSDWIDLQTGVYVRKNDVLEFGPTDYIGDRHPGYYKSFVQTRHHAYPTPLEIEALMRELGV